MCRVPIIIHEYVASRGNVTNRSRSLTEGFQSSPKGALWGNVLQQDGDQVKILLESAGAYQP